MKPWHNPAWKWNELKLSSPAFALDLPQHLDGVDQPHVRVVEVVESAEGEDAERPDEGLGDVGDDGAAAEQAGPDVVDHDGLDAWGEER